MISIKPHHFVDIMASLGAGKRKFSPHPYGHAVHTISQQILSNHDVLLEIELGSDDICKPCRHNVGGLCDDRIDISFRPAAPPLKVEWNLLIDQRWCERLMIRQGDRMSACSLAERIYLFWGDITTIYPELPAERATAKGAQIMEGIRYFLHEGNEFEQL